MDGPTQPIAAQPKAVPLTPPTAPQSIDETAVIMPWCSACGYPTLPRDRRCSECGTHIRIYAQLPFDPAVMIDELCRTLRALRWTALACFLSLLTVPISFVALQQKYLVVQSLMPAIWLSICIATAAFGAMTIRRSTLARAIISALAIVAVVTIVVLSIIAFDAESDPRSLSDKWIVWWAARDITGILSLAVLAAASIPNRATKALAIRGSLIWTVGILGVASLLTAVWAVAVAIFWYLGFAIPLIGCGIVLAAVLTWFPTVTRHHRFYQSWLALHGHRAGS